MPAERVTVQVESNIGEDGPLTVADTLHQLLDAFEVLGAAVASEDEGEKVRWRLVSMSKSSPATATAEAFSDDPAVNVGPIVYRGKQRLASGLAALTEGAVPEWMMDNLPSAKALLSRNLNGVGRTVFDLDSDAPRVVLIERTARIGLNTIEQYEHLQISSETDRSHKEFGTIDANVAEARTYHGQPALYVRDRITGRTFPCVLTEKAASTAGPTHSWQDTWSEKRVRIKGTIFYDRKGEISRVSASSVIDVNPSPVELSDLRKIDLLRGRTPVEHIDALWGYSDE